MPGRGDTKEQAQCLPSCRHRLIRMEEEQLLVGYLEIAASSEVQSEEVRMEVIHWSVWQLLLRQFPHQMDKFCEASRL